MLNQVPSAKRQFRSPSIRSANSPHRSPTHSTRGATFERRSPSIRQTAPSNHGSRGAAHGRPEYLGSACHRFARQRLCEPSRSRHSMATSATVSGTRTRSGTSEIARQQRRRSSELMCMRSWELQLQPVRNRRAELRWGSRCAEITKIPQHAGRCFTNGRRYAKLLRLQFAGLRASIDFEQQHCAGNMAFVILGVLRCRATHRRARGSLRSHANGS
jgi:hypothetical protein